MNYDCSNVLLEERWRFCANFKIGHERGRKVEPSTCPYRTPEYGCIGCTKFKNLEEVVAKKEVTIDN